MSFISALLASALSRKYFDNRFNAPLLFLTLVSDRQLISRPNVFLNCSLIVPLWEREVISEIVAKLVEQNREYQKVVRLLEVVIPFCFAPCLVIVSNYCAYMTG